MNLRPLALSVLALGLAAPGAAAQGTPPAPAPDPAAPAPAPAAGKLSFRVAGTLRDGRRRVVLAGGRITVSGAVRPFRPGQRVRVTFARGTHRLATRRVRIRQSGTRDRGTFSVAFRARRPGRLSVRALHRATPELATLRARPARLTVLRPRARPGGRGPVVRLLQAGLDRLRYAVPRSGVYDAGTGRAVLAYRKVNRMRRTSTASAAIIRAVVRGRGAYRARYDGPGRHVEADLSRQVLALVVGRRVVRTYHTSSGKSSTPTITGHFRVYRKSPGTNEKGMVDAVYFRGGYAVHGYASVPAYNASHGCLRVPIANARTIFDWLHLGDAVHVYR